MYSVILYALAGLLAVLSLVLLSGRGAFLIAGYNTASPQQKAAYDQKKLCRVTGGGLLVICVLLAVMAALGEDVPGWFPGVFIAVTVLDVAVMVWLTNKKCRSPDFTPPAPTEEERQRNRRITIGSLVFGVIVTVLVGVLLFTGDITPEYGEEAVVIRASYWSDLTIAYDDISAIELRTEEVPGARVGGFGSLRLQMGNFRSDEFGNYTRYTYTGADAAVVLTVRGRTVVLSGEDRDATQSLYETLCGKTGLF